MSISIEILETRFDDFVRFLKRETREDFEKFSNSSFIEDQENYKYVIVEQAKDKRQQQFWKPTDVGTGKVLKSVYDSIQTTGVYKGRPFQNNLINWRKKDNFKKSGSKALEQALFDFYKGKVKDEDAFNAFLKLKLSYQFIAYLFFTKDSDRYLPITQERFDQVFEDLGLTDFRTSYNASWENYLEFIGYVKQTREFLKTKDPNATLLDAHSFLYILGSQMKDASFRFSPLKSRSGTSEIKDDDDEAAFPEGAVKYLLHRKKERSNLLVQIAKQRHFQKDNLLRCQICKFSFVEAFGEMGNGFIEAHHIVPISQLTEETETKVEDLVMVCSNCHRMLHRKRPWVKSIEELTAIRKNKR